jgi:hypothetical protein
VLFCVAHRQSSRSNAAYFDYDDATKLDRLFNGCEVKFQDGCRGRRVA